MRTALSLTDEQFHQLWDTLHRSRSTSKTVTLDKQAVTNLLIDHSRMFNEVFPNKPSAQKKEPK